ncbi:hypothetical protein FOZ63_016433 [Perkinsus olseni]|uniref:Nuclease S1 n=1 Tax=Perkinsus olseni TaxID=32597 RepID=A0A7J6RLX8_PEROL|nr:hypothetical protein FOZ62_007815 [Perkinsus olseni]KAF4721593.1 hypothetical protein FOZ63_016433 [Perkinsus olseni]
MVFYLSVIAAALPAAFAWGPDGHAVVAQLSQERITDETQEAIDAIMGEGVPMYNYSSWADDIKYGPDGYKWRWSSPLHFADTPDCRFRYSRDCRNDRCVAGALKNYSRRVIDESLPLEQRQEALKFIVHFVGDAHQPLHAGNPRDLGGNKIDVDLGFARHQHTNLHSTWDSALLFEFQGRGRRARGEPYWTITEKAVNDELEKGGRYAGDVDDWVGDCEEYGLDVCVDKWVDETAQAACAYSYKHVNGSRVRDNDYLPMAYYNGRIEVAKEQLAKAGIRLTWLLNNGRGRRARGEPYWTITEKAVNDELEKGGRYAGDVDDWVGDCEDYGLDVCVDKWVDETAQAACAYSYKHVNGSRVRGNDYLPMAYYNGRIEVAKEQLAKAGIRLTWLLNNVTGSLTTATPDPCGADRVCSLTPVRAFPPVIPETSSREMFR